MPPRHARFVYYYYAGDAFRRATMAYTFYVIYDIDALRARSVRASAMPRYDNDVEDAFFFLFHAQTRACVSFLI